MNLVDNCLEPNDPLIVAIAQVEGPLAADQYLTEFNNACIQYAGFESVIADRSRVIGWFAPRTNLSTQEH